MKQNLIEKSVAKMKEFNEKRILESKELEYLVQKYRERNPISRLLIKNFYNTIQKIVLFLEPSDRVLEVGCGAGLSSLRIYHMLQGKYFEISDVDENAIRQFKEMNFPVPSQQESVLELKRKNGEFDCVFLLEVLEHVPEYKKALSELFRVSKKYVVVSTPSEPLWRILKVVWQEAIKSQHTATAGDAFVGTTRLRLANEGAAKNNIKQGLARISRLNL